MQSASKRLGNGKLRWGKFSASYRARLLEGARVLAVFLQDHGQNWQLISTGRSKVLDTILEEFIRNMHESGEKSALRVAKHALLYVQTARPRLRKTLKLSWNAIRVWEEQVPSCYRPPLPLPLLVAITCLTRVRAERESREGTTSLWYIFGALVNLAFFALLRPGELMKLKASDVTLPNSVSLGAAFSVIRIERPKNARQMGQQQFAEVHHPDIVNWVAWLVKTTNPVRTLWPSSATKFRSMFRNTCMKLGLEGLKLSPALLRAGGATWMLDEKIEVSRIRFHGRWANLRSLEHYLQVARAQQITLSLPTPVIKRIKHLIADYSFMLSLPACFAAQVSEENLLPTEIVTISAENDVVAAVRAWGKLGQSL